MEKPSYVKWIVRENNVVFEDGVALDCYLLDYSIDDEILDNWALHIRRHYISDEELIDDIDLLKMPVEQYLKEYIIPQKGEPFGPTARSNDISEILFADLLEFIKEYSVPRCKQHNRSGKNESEHGTDVIGYKFHDINKAPNKNDELITIEVKARLTAKEPIATIKDAVTDSKKDEYRSAHTLNYYRKKLRLMGKEGEANDIARFQQKTEYPYKASYIGAAITSQETIKDNIIVGVKGEELELNSNGSVFYVHGKDLMELTHRVFERCKK